MKYLNILYAEFKRFLNSIKMFLLGAIVLLFLIDTIAFCGYKYYSSTNEPIQSKIGVYSEESELNTAFLFYFLNAFESTSNYFSFESFDDYEDATKALKDNQIIALLTIPDEVVNGILSGSNEHMQIQFNNNSEIGSILLSELAHAGASMLSCAQASIYAITDVNNDAQLIHSLDKAYETINIDNMQVAIAREKLFRTIPTGTTGTIPVTTYYFASAIVIFLLLSGISFSSYLSKPDNTMLRQLKSQNKSVIQVYFARSFWLFVFYFMLILVAIVALRKGSLTGFLPSVIIIIGCALLSLTITLLIQLFYVIINNASLSLMVLFFTSIICHFMAGGIIPFALLPEGMKTISSYLPNYTFHHFVMELLTTELSVNNIANYIPTLIGMILIYALIITLVLRIKERRMRLC